MNTQTLNISLPVELVKRIDQLARRDYGTRSDFIRQAILEKTRQIQQWEKIYATGAAIAKKMKIKTEKDVEDIVYKFRHGKKKS